MNDTCASIRDVPSEFHLDAVGGVAGDMFIAAVLDAFPELAPGTLAAIRAVGGERAAIASVVAHRDAVLTGSRFEVLPPVRRKAHTPSIVPGSALSHTRFVDIRARIEGSTLGVDAKRHAIGIFTLLAEAEGRVHGVPTDEVGFHEVGSWDSIADIVGAAHLIAALAPATWTVGALPQGSGRVKTDHGWLPVPAPATARLLEGFELADDGIAGERVTPTGAAILRHLDAGRKPPPHRRRLVRSGCGFGTRTLPGLSNVLRLLAFAAAEGSASFDQVVAISFEVDDQSPEDLAIGLDRLRDNPAVLDVLQVPAYGKKGRVTAQIRILAMPDRLDEVVDDCFRETTTLGLRWQQMDRRVLQRSESLVAVDGRRVGVKVAQRPGGATFKVESDALRDAGIARREREALGRKAEAAAAAKAPAGRKS
jgi:uncharacterized protein (TIGR00299 family) protein